MARKTITWKQIFSHALKIKHHVLDEKDVPSIEGFSRAEILYIFAKSILSPGEKITYNSPLKNCKNPTGTNINQKLYYSEYKDVATRIVKFMDKNETSPNFINFKNEKISVRLAIFVFSKLLVSYNSRKQLLTPIAWDNNVFKKITIKKYGRSTKTGCDNRGQNNGYFCGPHMAQEIIRNLTGVVIPQSKIASIMGTTTAGTGHSGIDTFFAWFNKNYNYSLEWTWKNFSDLGWSGLKEILESNNQDAGEHELYRGTWGHYTNFDKIYENSVDVHNSLGSYCNGSCYCGYTENRSKSEARSYLNGISQKSILVVTRVK